MDERPARIDDVRYVPLTFVFVSDEERVGERAEHSAGVVEVEKDGTDRVRTHRPDAVGQDKPTLRGLER